MSDTRLVGAIRQLHELAAAREADGETDRALLQRFAGTRDRQAFEALMRRHGPMVLGVCRRMLRQEQDAEDVFQATFLILARKAASIRDPGAVVSWLYGVARRTARSAKRAAERRHGLEASAHAAPSRDPSLEAVWREVQTVLDAEINRLPDRLKAPFLLCHLEGQTRAEAGRQLGLAEGTVWSRLAEARKLLRNRLARRKITLSAVLGATGLVKSTEAAVPSPLMTSTARAAAELARGNAAAASAQALALADRGVRTMALARLKLALPLALVAGLLAAGAAVLAQPGPASAPVTEDAPRAPGAESRARTDLCGDPLPPGALVRMGTIRLRHREAGTCVAFTPTGRQLATAADDGWVRFWDLAGGKELLAIRAAEHRVSSLALSPEGKALATADGEVVRLWEAKTGHELRKIWCPSTVHNTGPLAFSSDGAVLAVAASDGSIRLFQPATGKERLTLPAQPERVRCLAFTADGTGLVSVGENAAALCVWDLSSGRLTRKVSIESPKDLRIRPLALALDGRTLAVESVTEERVKNAGGWDVFCQYRLCLRDVADGHERLRTDGERSVLWAAAFSADGKSVATAGMGDEVRVWDTMTGQLRVALEVGPAGSRPDAAGTLAFSPDGNRVASIGAGATVHIWDVTKHGELAGLPEGHRGPVGALAYAPDGRTLASAGDDGTIRLWDAATGRPQRVLKGHAAAVRALTFTLDRRTLASSDRDGALRLWDPATGKELRTIWTLPKTAGVYFGVCPIAFSTNGKSLASWSDDYRFRRWDVSTGDEIAGQPLVLSGIPPMPAGRPQKQPPEEMRVLNARLSPDGRTGAVLVGGTLLIVDTVSRQELFKLQGSSGVGCLAFSLDGRTLASAGWDKKLCLWDVTSGQELLRVEGLDFVNAVAIAPDGRTVAVATGFENAEVCLFNARTGAALLRLKGHASYAEAMVFAPDGKTLATGQRDTTALVWDLEPGLRKLGVPGSELSPEELKTHWEQLAAPDAKKARAAVETLSAAPRSSLPFMTGRLRPAGRVKPQHLQQLIADLDSEEYAAREAATKELANPGVEAEAALRRALRGNPSAEAKRRVLALLEGPPPRVVPSGEQLRRLRAIHVLEQIGSPEAMHILQELASGAPSARETQEASSAGERLAHRLPRP
jgi:RNA polymerase sigma factor (sigma-70 family)